MRNNLNMIFSEVGEKFVCFMIDIDRPDFVVSKTAATMSSRAPTSSFADAETHDVENIQHPVKPWKTCMTFDILSSIC